MVPRGCVPVWCLYNGDSSDDHYWTNQISGRVHKTHPLGLMFIIDDSFTGGFYEITQIEGLTFGEGEVWCSDTNQKIRVEKTDVRSIWNPFFQRYDPPCDCFRIGKIKKEMDGGSYLYFDIFIQCRPLFFDVYCNCWMSGNREHHTDSDDSD